MANKAVTPGGYCGRRRRISRPLLRTLGAKLCATGGRIAAGAFMEIPKPVGYSQQRRYSRCTPKASWSLRKLGFAHRLRSLRNPCTAVLLDQLMHGLTPNRIARWLDHLWTTEVNCGGSVRLRSGGIASCGQPITRAPLLGRWRARALTAP